MGRAMLSLSVSVLLAIGWLGHAGGQDTARSAPVAQQPSSVPELLACLDRAAAGMQDYTWIGTTEAGSKTQQFKMAFLRPHLVRIDTHSGQVAVQPNGQIKGRLGRGPLAKVAQTLSRQDKRLQDAEGIPFYESDFISMLTRIEAKTRGGAAATMHAGQTSYLLEILSGEITWRYRFASSDYSLLESSRWLSGHQVEITRYSDFHANTGLKTEFFRF